MSGDYKPNELSLNKESFDYHLPLEYELEANVDLKTLSYDIEDFEYNVKDDCLTVYIDFGIRYDEKVVEPEIPDITEEDLNSDFPTDMIEEETREAVEEDIAPEIDIDDMITAPTVEEDDRLTSADSDMIYDSVLDGDEFITYHVHIVREGDTLESIAEKYGCSIELIKEYNETDVLELKSKLIIPESRDE